MLVFTIITAIVYLGRVGVGGECRKIAIVRHCYKHTEQTRDGLIVKTEEISVI